MSLPKKRYFPLRRSAGLAFLGMFAVGALGFWAGNVIGSSAAPSSAFSSEEFERRVREYLMRDPDVVADALEILERRQATTTDTQNSQLIRPNYAAIFEDPDDPVGGNPDGDVTLVEFLDYNCPYCRQIALTIAQAQVADPNLRIIYKELPILGAKSVFAAQAALAAMRQGRYAAFHNAAMQIRSVADKRRE